MDFFNKEQSEIFKMEIDPVAKGNFLEMARWTKFLAVVGFVFLGLMLVVGLFWAFYFTTFIENYGGSSSQLIAGLGGIMPVIIIVFVIIMIAIGYYPVYALLKYSNCIKTALHTDDKEQFNRAIFYLKNMFKYQGIITIIFIALYGLQIILAIIGALGK